MQFLRLFCLKIHRKFASIRKIHLKFTANLTARIMATLKVELGNPAKDGSRKLYIILSHACTRKRIPTTISVEAKEVSPKTGRIISTYKQHLIDDLVTEYKNRIYQLDLELTGARVDADYIYQRITSAKPKNDEYDFFQFTEEWLKGKGKEKKNYATMLNSVEKYLGRRKLSFKDIDYMFLKGYSDYMSQYPRAQSHYLGLIRHIHNLARKAYNSDGNIVIPSTAIENFDFPRQQLKGGRAIELDILLRIFRYKPVGKRETLARDCAILSFCFMGMNSVDLYHATSFKGGVLAYNRSKTEGRRSDNAHIEVVADARIKALITKYADSTHAFSFHRRFATADSFNRSINIGLNSIMDAITAEISLENRQKKPKDRVKLIDTLQFYQFRHTWATIARNNVGIDKYTVHECLNHIDAETRIDDVYIKKDFSIINAANKKVLDYVFGLLDEQKKRYLTNK